MIEQTPSQPRYSEYQSRPGSGVPAVGQSHFYNIYSPTSSAPQLQEPVIEEKRSDIQQIIQQRPSSSGYQQQPRFNYISVDSGNEENRQDYQASSHAKSTGLYKPEINSLAYNRDYSSKYSQPQTPHANDEN